MLLRVPPSGGDPISHSQAHIPLKCVDIIWAKAARGVWGLAHVFNNKLFFTRDIMDDDAVPMQRPRTQA